MCINCVRFGPGEWARKDSPIELFYPDGFVPGFDSPEERSTFACEAMTNSHPKKVAKFMGAGDLNKDFSNTDDMPKWFKDSLDHAVKLLLLEKIRDMSGKPYLSFTCDVTVVEMQHMVAMLELDNHSFLDKLGGDNE